MIPIIKPRVGEAECQAVRHIIESGWLTQGPEVARFESEFGAFTGANHACAVSNCTGALHLALLVAGVGPGDEVITVSHSFIATANAVRHAGATPVFVDVERGTWNMDPALVEPRLTNRTKAILAVHQAGMPCDLSRLVPFARERGLPLVEDAACAIGSEVLWDGAWTRIGRPHGDVACFSFHPRKVLTTGDGGMLTTNNREWDERFRLLRQHGMDVSDSARHAAPTVTFERYDIVGFNYRLTDLQAAVGRVQLMRLPEILVKRRALAERYEALLARMPGVRCPTEPPWARTNFQSYVIELPPGVNQRETMQRMLDRGVSTRRGIMCAHREAPYAQSLGSGALPVSEYAQDRTILLPLYHDMSEADQDYVVDMLGRSVELART